MITPDDLKKESERIVQEEINKRQAEIKKEEQIRASNLEYYEKQAKKLVENPEELETLIRFANKEGCCGLELYRRYGTTYCQGLIQYRNSSILDTKYFSSDHPKFDLGFVPECDISATEILENYLKSLGYKTNNFSKREEKSDFDWEGGSRSSGEYYTQYYLQIIWK